MYICSDRSQVLLSNGPRDCEGARFVSVTTGLTVVSVSSSQGLHQLLLHNRFDIAWNIPEVVLVNTFGDGNQRGLLLGVDKPAREVQSDLDRLKEEMKRAGHLHEMKGVDFFLEDVSGNDPFAYFEGFATIPRVEKSGYYELVINTKSVNEDNEAKMKLDVLISKFPVRREPGKVVVNFDNVLEFIAYYDHLGKEFSLEKNRTWESKPLGKFERKTLGVGRYFWVRVEDPEFIKLDLARRQYNLILRLKTMGKVLHLENQLFGLDNNYLAVFEEKFSEADLGKKMKMLELRPESIPDLYIPIYQVDGRGFYSVSGRFPDDIQEEVKKNFAAAIKQSGAAGFSGGEPDFRLHFVNSRQAEAAFSLHRQPQYSSLNLQVNNKVVRREMKADPKHTILSHLSKVFTAGEKKTAKEPNVVQKVTSADGDNFVKVDEIDPKLRNKLSNGEGEIQSIGSSSVESSDSSTEAKMGREKPVCEMTELELLTINWQQGKTMVDALKSLAKFMVSIDVTEIVEQKGSRNVVFRMAEKKKFIKILKIYSRNESNSFDKLRSATPRLAFFPHGHMFGLSVTKARADSEFLKKLREKYPASRVEERSHVTIVWLHNKLAYFKLLTDKSFNVNFVPITINFAEIKSPSAGVKQDGVTAEIHSSFHDRNAPKVRKVNEKDVTTVEHLQMTEKLVFGLIWKNLWDSFKTVTEHILSRKLTDFIRNVECSDITNEEDSLVFHFSSQKEFNKVVFEYCPELIGNVEGLDSLERKFLLVASHGGYGVYSSRQVNPEDLENIDGCRLNQGHKVVWCQDKMVLTKFLRDPKIYALYAQLHIVLKHIHILNPGNEMQKVFVPMFNAASSTTGSIGDQEMFGSNVSFSKLVSAPRFQFRSSARNLPRAGSGSFQLPDEAPTNTTSTDRKKVTSMEDQDVYRNKTIMSAANEIQNILNGSDDSNLSLNLKDMKIMRIETQLKQSLGVGSDGVVRPQQFTNGAEDGQKPIVPYLHGIQSLFHPFNPENDVGLVDKLKEDISWFDPPISILERSHPTTGEVVLQIRLRNRELATAVLNGLKSKYPGLEWFEPGKVLEMTVTEV